MGEKETMAASRVFPETTGIAIDEEGVQRTAGPGQGIAIGEEGVQRAAGSGQGIAIEEEGVQRTAGGGSSGGPEPAEATNLNSSRSN